MCAYLVVVERTVVSDHLASEERDADDDDEEGVQRRTRDEQTWPVYTESSKSTSVPSETNTREILCPILSSDSDIVRLNMEVDLQKFIWAPCHVMSTAVLIG